MTESMSLPSMLSLPSPLHISECAPLHLASLGTSLEGQVTSDQSTKALLSPLIEKESDQGPWSGQAGDRGMHGEVSARREGKEADRRKKPVDTVPTWVVQPRKIPRACVTQRGALKV